MRKWLSLIVCACLLMGCHRAKESVQEQSHTQATTMDSFDDSYYRIVDIDQDSSELRENFYLNYGTGADFQTIGRDLQILSSEYFSIDDYYMSEGRYISLDNYNHMMKRKGDYSLQPKEGTTLDGVKNPYMVRSLQEQDYYKKSGKTFVLKGMSLSIIIDPRDGNNQMLDEPMSDKTIKEYGKEVIGRLYNIIQSNDEFEKIKDIPIFIAVYQATNTTISTVSGHYILGSFCDGTVGNIEQYQFKNVLFTSSEAEKMDKTTYNEFVAIKNALKDKAIEAAGLVGEARYRDNEIQSMLMTANLNVKTYTELLNLTALIADSVDNKFTYDFDCKVLVKSQDELQAVIIKTKGQKAKSYNLY